jgi:hypothetical protein
MAHFGLDLAYDEVKGKHQSVISHLKKIETFA